METRGGRGRELEEGSGREGVGGGGRVRETGDFRDETPLRREKVRGGCEPDHRVWTAEEKGAGGRTPWTVARSLWGVVVGVLTGVGRRFSPCLRASGCPSTLPPRPSPLSAESDRGLPTRPGPNPEEGLGSLPGVGEDQTTNISCVNSGESLSPDVTTVPVTPPTPPPNPTPLDVQGRVWASDGGWVGVSESTLTLSTGRGLESRVVVCTCTTSQSKTKNRQRKVRERKEFVGNEGAGVSPFSSRRLTSENQSSNSK